MNPRTSYSCSYCGQSFTTNQKKIQHESKSVKNGVGQCVSRKRKHDHSQSNTVRVPVHIFSCGICNFNGLTQKALNLHNRSLLHKKKLLIQSKKIQP